MLIPTIAPRINRRVDLTQWVDREPLLTLTGTIHQLTTHTITIIVESDGSRRSYLLEDVTLHEPWDERKTT